MIIVFPRPIHLDPETLLTEVAAHTSVPFSVDAGVELTFRFEGDLSEIEQAHLVAAVSAHDGSEAIATREAKRLRAEQIIADNQALVDAARAKRLAGENLTQQELAAIADLFMFQGFQPQ